MGVLRRDPQGRQRWLGNLKEFKFGTTTDALGNSSIFLADADGVAAVNNQTGFITPSARRFWRSCPSGVLPPCPSSDVGFWAFNPQGIGGQYDVPDGDLVEKGAAAQRLRDTLKVSGVSTRNVYTFNPAWTSGALLSTYKFDTSNTAVVNALSGTSSTVSLSRAGPTVTATSASDLLLGA